MCLKIPEQLRHSTAFRLTFWYASIFIVSWVILLLAGFSLMDSSIRTKDQQIVSGMLDKYAVVAGSQGRDDLLGELERQQLAHITGGYFVIVRDADQRVLYLSLPYEWRLVTLQYVRDNLQFSHNGWVTLHTDEYVPDDEGFRRSDELEILGRRLADGTMLQIGFSAETREEYLEHFRNSFFMIMVPVVLISIGVGALLAWRSLRPVRDLTEAVGRVQSGRIDARVRLRDMDNEMRVLAGQFNVMLERIEGLINGMREALDNVAHDLRTPLMRMRISIEQAVTHDDPHELREALLDCAEESEHISAMLTVLMDISEAQTGAMRLDIEEIALSGLVEDVRDLFVYPAEEKQITMEMHVPHALTLRADPIRLRQVLNNLVDNAVKYTPTEGNIRITAEKIDHAVRIMVRDSGVGISTEDSDRIFDRLYRADSSRSVKGQGLGLALVKAIVEAHGGRITVESAPGEGACFIVLLPG